MTASRSGGWPWCDRRRSPRRRCDRSCPAECRRAVDDVGRRCPGNRLFTRWPAAADPPGRPARRTDGRALSRRRAAVRGRPRTRGRARVTTNAVCSPMSTALSPTRSSARATSIMCIAHSRVSGSSPISMASAEDLAVEAVDLAVLAGQVLGQVDVARLEGRAWPARPPSARRGPSAGRCSSTSVCTGGSWPDSGMSLAMFTHWSPMRSTCLMTCSSAATSRRSVATGAWSASSDRTPWWTSR